MGSPDGDSGQLSAGRLAYGCTDLSTSWPHGGTGFGLVGQVFVFPQRQWKALDAEETSAPVEVLWLGGPVVVSFTLEGWDEDAAPKIFPNTGTTNSRTVVEWPGSDVAAGAPITALSNVVFTPWDTTNGKGFVLYSAVPVVDVNAELAFSAGRFLEVPAVLVGLPNGSGNVGKLGRFADLGSL
jgi:hypothetical protein